MPKIRTNRSKPPPEGFEEIEPILDEYARKMRDGQSTKLNQPLTNPSSHSQPLLLVIAISSFLTLRKVILYTSAAESADHEGKRKNESVWPIMRINHVRSRYIYDLYYKREAISTELYEWLLEESYADAK